MRAVATFGGIGLLPGPRGTWGALAAVPAGYALHWAGGFPLLLLAVGLGYGLGLWSVRALTGEADFHPGQIVIDEVVGMWIALLPLSLGLWMADAPRTLFPWPGWVIGFVVFRLLDVCKPGPVGWADRRRGPAGIMLGDAIAGALAALLVTALAAVAHGWLA
jgi:phosphatidylglycerophosphatase A